MKTNVESIFSKMGRDEKMAERKVGNRKIQKVRKPHHHHQIERREEDSAEIKAYLNKLQDIVPLMPKNKRLSKLEVISNVIEYIRDLRQTLGLPPSCANDDDNDFDMVDSETSMFTALAQAAVAKSTAAVATLTVINNNNVSSSSSMESPVSYCHPHPQIRQPLAAIANPTHVGSSS